MALFGGADLNPRVMRHAMPSLVAGAWAIAALLYPSHPTGVRYLTQSGNWSGYEALSPVGNDDGVAGTWAVPAVTPEAGHYLATWVGVDGKENQDLIQVGTAENGGSYYAWWEILPAYATTITTTRGAAQVVRPGDRMVAWIRQDTGHPLSWTIHIEDATRHWAFDSTRPYSGPGTSAEWITEAPNVNGRQVAPPPFAPITMSGIEVDHRGTWSRTQLTEASNAVEMVDKGGNPQTTVSSPGVSNSAQYFRILYVGRGRAIG